jgi:hypothetical protein
LKRRPSAWSTPPEQAAWAAGRCDEGISSWGLFTGGGSPHYFVIYLTKLTHVSIH